MYRWIMLAVALGAPWTASAKILGVGPDQPYKQPSEAVAAASNGDVVRIEAGQYFDCAIVNQDNLIIEGMGPTTVMTDKACAGKGLLIINGSNVVVRSLTLQRARVPDHNGAGIRAEGGSLLIDGVTFLNNENGILTADNPSATLRIMNSTFVDNGKCDGSCSHGVYSGHWNMVHIEGTRFFNTKQAHSIKSRALSTEVINCNIQDGPSGTSSYLIEVPNGGNLLVEGNTLEKGPHSENAGHAIMIGSEGVTQPTGSIVVRKNTFTNDQNRSTTFVTNLTATPAALSNNVFKGQVDPLTGDGKSN